MSGRSDTARSLYLELRALGFKLRVEEGPEGVPLEYGIGLNGFRGVSLAHACRLRQRVLENEDDLVRVLIDLGDPDLDAIRKEGHYG